MRLNFNNSFQRLYALDDGGYDYNQDYLGGGGGGSGGSLTVYDGQQDSDNWYYEDESDIIDYELPAFNAPSLNMGTLTPIGTPKAAVEPVSNTSPWLGSIHSLVQDASTILLATKGVPQTQQPIAVMNPNGTTQVYSSAAAAQAAALAAATQKKNTTTFIIIGVLFLLIVVAVVVLMRKGSK